MGWVVRFSCIILNFPLLLKYYTLQLLKTDIKYYSMYAGCKSTYTLSIILYRKAYPPYACNKQRA